MHKEKLVKYFNFEDLVRKDPNYEPYIPLVEHASYKPTEHKEAGLYEELIGHRSYMVNVDLKERVFSELEYSNIVSAGIGYFDIDATGKRRYVFDESWDHGYREGLIVEPLFVERSWPGLKMNCIEPCQRIIRYLNLKENNGNWIDPYTDDVVIRIINETETKEGIRHEKQNLDIKIDYLKDFLAARGAGLYIARYASRALLFNNRDDVPLEPDEKEIENKARWRFIINEDSTIMSIIAKGKVYAAADLWQKFWIDPFPEARRWDALTPSEFKGDVLFTLQDGSKAKYDVEAGHSKDYFKFISFSPRIMEVFIKRKYFSYEESSSETRVLRFPTGERLDVALNPSGQIQVLWGLLAKIDTKFQQILAPYSEAMLQQLSETHDYIRIHIFGNWPEKKSLKKNLMLYKTEINEYFLSRFGETFFNQDSTEEELKKVHEPYEESFDQLVDIMMILDNWLFSEKRPDNIIKKYQLADEIDDKSQLDKIKSLISLKLLLKKFFGNDEAETKVTALKIIKDLRNCKGHKKNIQSILEKYSLQDKAPIEAYKKIIMNLDEFLEWFLKLCRIDYFRIE